MVEVEDRGILRVVWTGIGHSEHWKWAEQLCLRLTGVWAGRDMVRSRRRNKILLDLACRADWKGRGWRLGTQEVWFRWPELAEKKGELGEESGEESHSGGESAQSGQKFGSEGQHVGLFGIC